MPVKPFREVRVGIAEVSVMRFGMEPPRVGDIIRRDGQPARVITSTTHEPTETELAVWKNQLRLGDFISSIEYEPLGDLRVPESTVTELSRLIEVYHDGTFEYEPDTDALALWLAEELAKPDDKRRTWGWRLRESNP